MPMSDLEGAPDYGLLYSMESYLLETVNPRFHEHGSLSAFDFFCIVIWKANRAKTVTARRLLRKGFATLDEAVRSLTVELRSHDNDRDRLKCLFENWGFALPMATAILTVLYPDAFTIYDSRVCGMLGGDHFCLSNKTSFDSVWKGYLDFKAAVIESTPAELSLRNKDRYLWGKSFYQQLCSDVEAGFGQTK